MHLVLFLFSAAAAAAASGAPSGSASPVWWSGVKAARRAVKSVTPRVLPWFRPANVVRSWIPRGWFLLGPASAAAGAPSRSASKNDFGSAPRFISNRFGVWRSSSTKGINRQIVSRPNAGKALGAESRERECARVCVACCVEAVLLI
uniref:(northern house mosquito) hypothetical protein n=1 Tax=Culex pipiens TaxID=7175 RepID=A0A8D8BMN4_CULPI